ncbi:MAG: DNA recombination protein RmuC [Actinobacteria bacterium]|nr:DNA recombination protein RmuC [Actinomycetota bacterium]
MESIFYAILGCLIGFVLGYIISMRFGPNRGSGAQTELAAAQATITEIRNQLADAKERIENFEQRERDAASSESKYLQELRPLQAKLNEMQEKVVNAERERVDQFTLVQEQILESRKQQEVLTRNTQALAGALSNNQVRGQWGELTLRRMLEQSGLRVGIDFIEQYQTTNEDGKSIRPDVIIQMPDGKFVAVDAKVPYNNFQRAFEIPEVASETDEKRRKEFLKQHVADVKKKINELDDSEYFSGLPSSPEFTILFMPSESLLSVTLEHDPTILEYAFQKRIALVSPVSFFSVLKTVSYTWKQNAQEDVIKEIVELGVKLYGSVRVLAEHAADLGGKLNGSVKAYNAFVGSLESNMLKSSRDLNDQQMKILDRGKTIPEIAGIEETTRIFTKSELTSEEEPKT